MIGVDVFVVAAFERSMRGDENAVLEYGASGRDFSAGLSSAKASLTMRCVGRVDAWVRDGVEPVAELRVEIIEVAERAAEEEVLADVSERPLHFALGFGPIGSTGTRLEAVVPCEVEEATVVNDQAVGILADHRRLHAVVENFLRNPADRFERRNVTAQDGLQVLVDDEARPDQPREAVCG